MARGTWMPLAHGETCRDILLRLAVVLVPLLVVLTVLATLGWLGLAVLARVGWLGTRLLHRMRWAVRHVSSPLLACSVPQGVLPGHPRFGWPFLWPLSCVPQRLSPTTPLYLAVPFRWLWAAPGECSVTGRAHLQIG